mgnify:CR=1 FL=1
MTEYEKILTVTTILSLVVAVFSVLLAYMMVNIEKNRDKIELEKGQYALLNLTSRYFIINYQRADFTDTKFKVKTDSCFTNNYVKELELIASKFDDLTNSPFFTLLYKENPVIGSIPVFIKKKNNVY